MTNRLRFMDCSPEAESQVSEHEAEDERGTGGETGKQRRRRWRFVGTLKAGATFDMESRSSAKLLCRGARVEPEDEVGRIGDASCPPSPPCGGFSGGARCSIDPWLTRQIGQATYAETMQQFQGQILPPNHPITRRVREIAKRIVERNGLGRIKEGHSLSTIEEVMGAWGQRQGMESPENIEATEQPNANAEWEVSRSVCLDAIPVLQYTSRFSDEHK